MDNSLINIAQLCNSSTTLGPGQRFVLWVQGCPFNCHNCVSPEWIPMRSGQVWDIEDLAQHILAQPDLDGISISGGEPFLQGSALARLLQIILKQRPDWNTIIFTGFQLSSLSWPEAHDLLNYVDVLIAGLYVEKLNDGRGLRGSSNQLIHYLSPKLKEFQYLLEEAPRELEFFVDDTGVLMIGIPEKNFEW